MNHHEPTIGYCINFPWNFAENHRFVAMEALEKFCDVLIHRHRSLKRQHWKNGFGILPGDTHMPAGSTAHLLHISKEFWPWLRFVLGFWLILGVSCGPFAMRLVDHCKSLGVTVILSHWTCLIIFSPEVYLWSCEGHANLCCLAFNHFTMMYGTYPYCTGLWYHWDNYKKVCLRDITWYNMDWIYFWRSLLSVHGLFSSFISIAREYQRQSWIEGLDDISPMIVRSRTLYIRTVNIRVYGIQTVYYTVYTVYILQDTSCLNWIWGYYLGIPVALPGFVWTCLVPLGAQDAELAFKRDFPDNVNQAQPRDVRGTCGFNML